MPSSVVLWKFKSRLLITKILFLRLGLSKMKLNIYMYVELIYWKNFCSRAFFYKSILKIFDTMRDKFGGKWRITWLPVQYFKLISMEKRLGYLGYRLVVSMKKKVLDLIGVRDIPPPSMVLWKIKTSVFIITSRLARGEKISRIKRSKKSPICRYV